jgi:mRNA interferase MazF
MIQGDICYHTFKSPDKRRPVLILTRSSAISDLTWVTIAPITTTLRQLPTEVWLDEDDGMSEICTINLDNI